MFTVTTVLAVLALLCAILAATPTGVPLWVAVVLLCILEILRVFPLGK